MLRHCREPNEAASISLLPSSSPVPRLMPQVATSAYRVPQQRTDSDHDSEQDGDPWGNLHAVFLRLLEWIVPGELCPSLSSGMEGHLDGARRILDLKGLPSRYIVTRPSLHS